MRIVQVTPRYFPNVGGVEVVAQRIGETLVEKGIETAVFSIDRSKDLRPVESVNGVAVKRFNALVGDPLYLPEPRFVDAFRKEKADIVHVHNIHTLLPALVALFRRSSQKMLLQPHYHRYGQSLFRQSLFQLYKREASDRIFSRTHLILTNSVYEERILREDFPNVKNVVLLPEGIDTEDSASVEHDPVEPKRILYVGALRKYKNVDKILEAFAYLVKSGNGEFKMVIVGDGPERDSLVNLASSLGVGGLIEWKPQLQRKELLSEYAQASVFVLLSYLESFSRVVYDALIIGVPVVVLNFGALSHLVVGGFAEGVDSLAPEVVASAVLKCTQGTYAPISSSKNVFLDWKSYANRIVSVYEQLCET